MQILPIIGVAIALTQAAIAIAVFWFSRQQHFTQMRTQRAVRIHEWSNDCLCAFAEAEHFYLLKETHFSNNGNYEIRKIDLLYRLSALIDQGRLFFGNVDQDKYGQEKFPARRGYRPEILDPLVAAYHAVRIENVATLPGWRARFVSLIQYEVDPQWLRKETYYGPVGPGAKAGISLGGSPNEPPPWPRCRTSA